MHRALIALFFGLAGAYASAEIPRFGGGLGVETRIQREVNPDYAETKTHAHVFAQMLFINWGGHLEVSSETQSSHSGGLNVTSRSYNVGVWGRYKFLEQKLWRPFASLGVGDYRDNVKSEFAGSSNETSGHRFYFGGGGGISVIFWEHLLFEAEARGALIRERKEPMVSALLRIGCLF